MRINIKEISWITWTWILFSAIFDLSILCVYFVPSARCAVSFKLIYNWSTVFFFFFFHFSFCLSLIFLLKWIIINFIAHLSGSAISNLFLSRLSYLIITPRLSNFVFYWLPVFTKLLKFNFNFLSLSSSQSAF